jgi:Mg-chelatase subunit ChlD
MSDFKALVTRLFLAALFLSTLHPTLHGVESFPELKRRFTARYSGGDYREKIAAIREFLDRGGLPALQHLVNDVIPREEDQYVFEKTMDALKGLQDKRCLRWLVGQANAHPLWQMRSILAGLLGDLKVEGIHEALIQAIADKHWSVRARALESMGKQRHRTFIEPLIERLKEEKGRLRGDVVDTLESLTGADLGRSYEAWSTWWRSVKKDFRMPLHPRVRKREKRADVGTVTRQGLFETVISHRVIFVVDISGSMDNGTKAGTRLAVTKRELWKVLKDQLHPKSRFNIIVYADKAVAWRPKLVKASGSNKISARRFIQKLKAYGNTSTYEALEKAFGDRLVDTIYLLSDGVPTVGKVINTEIIKSEIRRLNRARHITIHTTAFLAGEDPSQDKREAKAFMKELAAENGGVYKLIE